MACTGQVPCNKPRARWAEDTWICLPRSLEPSKVLVATPCDECQERGNYGYNGKYQFNRKYLSSKHRGERPNSHSGIQENFLDDVWTSLYSLFASLVLLGLCRTVSGMNVVDLPTCYQANREMNCSLGHTGGGHSLIDWLSFLKLKSKTVTNGFRTS